MRRAAGTVVPAAVTVALSEDALHRAAGQDPGATPFRAFARVAAQVAAGHPLLRSRLDGEALHVHPEVNLGIAVTAADGDLCVGVVRAADTLSAEEFADRYEQAVSEARAGSSVADETVSLILSHLDDTVITAVPAVVPPATATLFLGGPRSGVREMVLAFDHCVLNGRQAADFLGAIRAALPGIDDRPVAAPAGPAPLARLLEVAARVLGHPVDADLPLQEQGMTSADAARLAVEAGTDLGVILPVVSLWRFPRPRDLAAHLRERTPRDEPAAAPSAARQAVPELPDRRDLPDDAVAVIGMSCVVPGADGPEEFWRLLRRGECHIGPVPAGRRDTLGDQLTAALLDRIDLFDADAFGLTARQAAAMDPQQRMLLELSRHALDHAGIDPATLAGTDTGVYVAACGYDYRELAVTTGAADGYATVGTFPAFLANRISFQYDLTGPSITLDTACSGGLTALAVAIAGLRGGDCSTALVGAANLLSNRFNTDAYGRAGMLSPRGNSRVFDSGADGFVRGEGAGWVVLKPMAQARADGDPVLAVIRGVAVNHGGRAASLTAPNPAAHTRLISQALRRAGVAPDRLGYLEAHGTGTALGDPIEIAGLLGALDDAGGVPERAAGPGGTLWVGSVKSNIGHLEAAAGLIGLIKVIQVLRHGEIPVSVGHDELNPAIELDGAPIGVPTRNTEWPGTPGQPRIAAVSAFGFGGANAHAIVEQAPEGYAGRQPLPPYEFRRRAYWLAGTRTEPGNAGTPQPGGDHGGLERHAVRGRAVLPGAAMLDTLAPNGPLELSQVRFLRPVDAGTALTADRDGTRLTVLAEGEPCLTAIAAPAAGDIGAETPGTTGGTAVDLTALLRGRGIEVGPVYQIVHELRRDGDHATGVVTAPPNAERRVRRIAWLDAVLQTSHCVLDTGGALVAAGIDGLGWTGDVPARATVHVRRRDAGTGHATVDVIVPGVARVHGLRLRAVDQDSSDQDTTDHDGPAAPVARLLTPRWVPAPLSGGGERGTCSTVIVHDDITAGTASGDRVDAGDAGLRDHLRAAARRGPLDVHLLVGGARWTADERGVRALRGWLAAVLTVAEVLAETGNPATVRLITTGLAAPLGGAPRPGAALQGALLGAVRSIPLELPAVTVCAVDLAGSDADPAPAALEPCSAAAPLIAVRHGQRWRQALADTTPAGAAPSGTTPSGDGLRPGGTYVILGGTGGIGSAVARHLAARYDARLLLTGRSAESDPTRQLLDDLVAAGGRAAYEQADIAHTADLDRVLSRCRELYGKPDAVLHTVGSVSAARIGELTVADLDMVLATKVTAVLDLHRRLDGVPLMLSSSIAGLFGSEGGLNYAAANSFLDFFAAAADGRPGPVRSVDWGLWQDTGLARRFTRHVLRSYPGLTAFTARAGVAALEAALAGDDAQVVALAGDPVALHAHLAAPVPAEPPTGAAKELDRYVRALIARRLHEAGLTDPDVPLEAAVTALRAVPAHHRLVAALLDVLGNGGVVAAEPAGLRRTLLDAHPDLDGHVELLDRVADQIGPVLRGEVSATGVLFPRGDLGGVSRIYSGNSLFDPANTRVAEEAARLAAAVVARGRRPQILEVGAGVGGTTQVVRPALPDDVDYVYTDLSPAFLNQGRSRFGDTVRTAILNAERDPVAQGFAPGTFDLILASNVVHATADLSVTLRNLGTLLAPGGHLVLGEMVVPATVYTTIFGITDGWWRTADPQRRMPHGPLLDVDRWRRMFAELGWQLSAAPHSGAPGAVTVLTATPGPVVTTTPQPAPAAVAASAGTGTEPTAQPSPEPGAETPARIGEELRAIVRRLTGEDDATVPGDATWQEMGIDSLLNNELVDTVARRYDVDLAATALFEHRTLDALAAHLASVVPAAPTPAPQPVPQPPAGKDDDGAAVAVVGLAGRYPGAGDVDALWELLREGRSTAREVPADRWDWRTARTMSGGYARWGCFLDDHDGFDAELFRIAPRDAAAMDPQERAFLEVAWTAFENAGYARRTLAGRPVGVYAGVTGTSGLLAGRDRRRDGVDNPEYAVTALASVANRVSHAFDLRGPSLSVDTMCSSSLTAVHLAAQALTVGEVDLALAGGVNLYLHPDRFTGLCALGMPSHGDATRAFGAGGDGFVPGEGAGALVLKRLADAQADGDTVYAVIRGTAVNHGGGTGGYTVPNPVAQAELITRTLRRAGLTPADIGAVEAHGTGTELGDPIELRALTLALDGGRDISLGSVKSNIGHGEAAAGVAGLTKAILQLWHATLVPTLHIEQVNPKLRLDESPLRLQRDLAPWPDGATPRRIAVSSFGAGGANAHVILEEMRPVPVSAPGGPVTVSLSAPDPQRLAALAGSLAALAADETPRQALVRFPDSVADLAHTLNVGREPFGCTATVTGGSRAELAAAFAALAKGDDHPGVRAGAGDVAPTPGRRVALPTTAFHRAAPAVSGRTTGLPLLGAVTAPTGQDAEVTLTATTPLLADHVVDGTTVLPGALHPELVYEALLAAGRSPYDISLVGLTWPEQAGGAPLTVRVEVGGDVFRCRVGGRTVAEGSVGARRSASASAASGRPGPDLADAGAGDFYAAFAAAGFAYGRTYRTITAIHNHGDRVTARFALADGQDPDGRQVLHPAVLDAACQVAAWELVTAEPAATYRPLGIDRLTAHRPAGNRGTIEVRRTGALTFDLVVRTADGEVAAEAEGFTVSAGTARSAATAATGAAVAAYRHGWTPDEGHGGPVERIRIVGRGAVAGLGAPATGPAAEVIVDLTGYDDGYGARAGAHYGDFPAIESFRLLRDLIRDRDLDGGRVHLLTAADGPATPLSYALHGLVRTVAGETSRLGVRLVTVTRQALGDPRAVQDALTGDSAFTSGSWLRLHGAQRERAVLTPQPLTTAAPMLAAHGCHLIVGGLGGLGRTVAADLLRRCPEATVVLAGRAPDAGPVLAELRRIAPAARLRYRRCDVTDPAQVRALAADEPGVTGIVYLAGVLRDGFLRTKPDHNVRAVCDAKVLGAVTVDDAFAGHRLNFFVIASSLAAAAGNQGQSDYAFANGFLDGFATARAAAVARGERSGRTLSAGLPVLADAGMLPDEASRAYLAETLGLTPMPSADAAELLWRACAADGPAYLALVHGDRRRWEAAVETADSATDVAVTPAATGRAGAGAAVTTVEPGTVLLDWLRVHVAQAVGIEPARIEADRDLIEYGVDSMALMRLNRGVEAEIGRLPMSTLMDCATLAGLARRIEADHGDRLGAIAAPAAAPAGPATGNHLDEVLPERLLGIWIADQAAAPAAPYNISLAWRLPAGVDENRLAAAVTALSRRHPVLASRLTAVAGEVRLTAGGEPPALAVRRTGEPVAEQVRREAGRRFRLEAEAPLRAVLWRGDDEPGVLQLITHHLVVDGRSAELLRDDLAALYAGTPLPPAPPLGAALRAEHEASAERLAACETFWADRLGDAPDPVLFADAVDPAGGQRYHRFPTALTDTVTAVAGDAGVTPFVVLFAAFALAVARRSGHLGFTAAVPVYGRPGPEYDATVGCFVNPVPLRVDIDPRHTVRQWFGALRDEVRDALEHVDLPYPRILRHAAGTPRLMFTFQNWQRGEPDSGILTDLLHERGQQGHFDLALEITAGSDGLAVRAAHRTGALAATDVDTVVNDVRRMLAELAELAGDLDGPVGALLDPGAATLVSRIRQRAGRHPGAVAVQDATRTLTYRELTDLAARVSRAVSAAAELGEPVAVLLPRDATMPAVLLGVLGAGCPYVPLDPAYPPERLALVIEGAGCRLAIASDDLRVLLPDDVRVLDPATLPEGGRTPDGPGPDDLAYLMFTSGSTGRPKGVGVTHSNVVHTLDAIAATAGLGATDRLLAVTTVGFDISVLELFLPLLTGGTVVVADRTTVLDANRLGRALDEHRITVMQATPSGWQLLVDGGWAGRPGLTALCGGEPLPEPLAEALRRRTGRLWNVYGPTEATIWSTMGLLRPGEPVHLGEPIGATGLVVTREGELLIGGPAVAAGYWRRPELSAERFVVHPSDPDIGGRWFRTGDLVRRDDAGRLLFLGRIDDQVKIRGYRVELGEIESVLGEHPAVARAVVILTGEGAHARLTAVVQAKPGAAAPGIADLRVLAGRRLPPWMVPDRAVPVADWPMTSSNKVDRRAVAGTVAALAPEPPTGSGPPPISAPPAVPAASAAPAGTDLAPVVRVVAQAWTEVLGTEPSADRTFFEAGGNSLLLGHLYARLGPLFPDSALEVADLFAHPTITDQAELISARTVRRPATPPGPSAPLSRRALRRALRLGEAG